MKILWLAGWYPHSKNPLAGNFIARHAAAVSKVSGEEIHVLHFAPFSVTIWDGIRRLFGRKFSDVPEVYSEPLKFHSDAVDANFYISEAGSDAAMKKSDSQFNIPGIKKEVGVKVEVVAVPQIKGLIFKLLNLIIYYRRAHRVVHQKLKSMDMPRKLSSAREYGIVHVHAADKIGIVATWFQKEFRYRIFYTEHWAIFNEQAPDRFSLRNPWFQFSFRVLWRHTDVVAAISNTMLKQMETSLGKSKASVLLPNVVDPALLSDDSRELKSSKHTILDPVPLVSNSGIESSVCKNGDSVTTPKYADSSNLAEIVFLHISNLEDRKNVAPLMSAFLELKTDYPLIRLVIVGSNQERFELVYQQAIQSNSSTQHKSSDRPNGSGRFNVTAHLNGSGLSNVTEHPNASGQPNSSAQLATHSIEYHESRPVGDLKEFYQNASALVLPSAVENSPCVIVEAHYFGLPVIATKTGGVAEMVNHSNGILMSVKTSPERMKKEIKSALLEFIEHRSNFDSEQIKRKAKEQFHPDNAVVDLVKTYASLKFTDQP